MRQLFQPIAGTCATERAVSYAHGQSSAKIISFDDGTTREIK